MKASKPSKAELEEAHGKSVPDVIAPGLLALFCGINPGLYSGAVGHHFARPGNRFWPALYRSGFTPRLLRPKEERELLAFGLGITNFVERSTASAAELTPQEIILGGRRLREKVARYKPRCLAVLGIGAYRVAFGRKQAAIGPQAETSGNTLVWVLPNPSGLNAHYQLDDLASLFRELKDALQVDAG
jgi:double-stranded uracil-DNA glycosylase